MQGTLLVFTRAGAPARRVELDLPRLLVAAAGLLLAIGVLGLVGWECGRVLSGAAL
jgi:hypothetical protein